MKLCLPSETPSDDNNLETPESNSIDFDCPANTKRSFVWIYILRTFITNESIKYSFTAGLFKFWTWIRVKSWHILTVYCVRLSHATTCPFSKNFQILSISAQIFKYLTLQHFLALFLGNHTHALSKTGPQNDF